MNRFTKVQHTGITTAFERKHKKEEPKRIDIIMFDEIHTVDLSTDTYERMIRRSVAKGAKIPNGAKVFVLETK